VGLLLSYGASASDQSTGIIVEKTITYPDEEVICVSIVDAQEMTRRLKDYELLKQVDEVKDQRIFNLEKELDLATREIKLHERIIAIKDMEIQAQTRAITDLKDITDRAIKLAETSKPKSNLTQTLGLLGAILAIGLAIGIGL